MRRVATAVVAVLALVAPAAVTASSSRDHNVTSRQPLVTTGSFLAGAAKVDITPPARAAATDAAEFVPACGTSPTVIDQLWPGPREFAFEKPYVDLFHSGRWAPGDPYCDSDHTLRYEAPYVAGGSGENHWPLSTDPASPISAQALVFGAGGQRIALVVVDSIGMFNVTMDQIRSAVRPLAPDVRQVFVSSTHDESAPDPIGLWGPDLSDVPGSPSSPAAVSSGVDEMYMQYLVGQVAGAVAAADAAAEPATLKLATARQPSNTQSCWSSYPYIDDQLLPVMQGVASGNGRVIFTLVNANTHVESLAFSGKSSYLTRLSGDWPGRMRAHLEASYPGSVGVELTGLVGSVETPTVYEPESTQVVNVPGSIRSLPGNPDGCKSVYPSPPATVATPVTDAESFIEAYGKSVADTAVTALAGASSVVPASLAGLHRSVCVPLQNNLFVAAFAAGLFPDRPAFADPQCTVGVSTGGRVAGPASGGSSPAGSLGASYVRTDVGVVRFGPVQIAYSPGEVFPFTETRGAIDNAQMPFPTDCYNPMTNDFYCGTPLPMTPWISAAMAGPYRFMAGLGEDMIGYLFPPGNFVGSQGESVQQPWLAYENSKGDHDRFGHGHPDDSESVGPYAGLAVTGALQALLDQQGGVLPRVLPGLFVDAAGRLSDSPFASAGPGFGGATGVVVALSNTTRATYPATEGWATYFATPDTGTAGTGLRYSVATAGVFVNGAPLLIDVFAGAHQFGLPGA